MPEIRTPEPHEMEDVLAIMCEAFELPYASARKLFYKDPYFKACNKRILIDDGIVASCLTIVPVRMWIGDAMVDVAGIANVATLLSHRNRGCASRLLKDTVNILRERGYGFAALLPYSYDFYRPFGWETAGVQYKLRTQRSLIGMYAEARLARQALPSDLEEIAALYAVYSRGKTGRCERSAERWAYLFEHSTQKIVFKRQRLEGYAFYDLEEKAPKPKQIAIQEFVTTNDEAQRGLLGYLSAKHPQVSEIGYCGAWSDIELSGLATISGAPGNGPSVETESGLMFRIVDFKCALDALAPNFAGFTDAVTLLVDDALSELDGPIAITVQGNGRSLNVRHAQPRENLRHRISGSVGSWSSVLLGHHSLEDAVSAGTLRAFNKSSAAAASRLFPRRFPFIPPLDHF